MEQHKKIIATLCYIMNGDEVLMLHRTKKENDMHKDMYNGLGGKIEKGEDPYTCVIREVYEEAGVDIVPLYAGNLTFENFQKDVDWEVHLFIAHGFRGSLSECNEGDLVWVNKKDLFNLDLWPGDRIFLKKMFENKFFFGRFKYEHGKLLDHKIFDCSVL